MSKHPNLTSGPLINGAGIVSITQSFMHSVHLTLNEQKTQRNNLKTCKLTNYF